MNRVIFLLAGLLMANACTPSTGQAGDPPAAARAFCSTDPVVQKALHLLDSGKFKQAELLLAPSATHPSPQALQDRAETLEIIRRIRIEYSLDAATLLAKVRKSIPDATAKEVNRWARESHSRSRIIDGTELFFRREPQNIYLFSQEAADRRAKAGNAPAEEPWKLTDHLRAVIEEADKSKKVEVLPVHHKVTHTLTIPPNTPGLKTGSVVRVWLPFPQEYHQQRQINLLSASPEPHLVAPDGSGTDARGAAAQRSVYFETRVTNPAEALEFKEVFEYTSFAHHPNLVESEVQAIPLGWQGAFLGERLPHIAFTPAIRRQVAKIIEGDTNPLVKARKIFRWVSANVPWNAEDEYCIIPSLAVKGFTARRGDCGVQNTVFITMCRIAGVPARWQSGFETKPTSSWGMHDWAEIYIAPWGWLPADASYGVQKSDDPRIADFYCGHQDSYRLIVNLDWGRELFPPKESLRSEPADFQRGEVEVDGKNLYFNLWDTRTEIDRSNPPDR